MNRMERIYRIVQLLSQRDPVSRSSLLSDMAEPQARTKRDLEYTRHRLSSPIASDRELGRYQFSLDFHRRTYQLPSVWFSATGIVALLTMRQLLDSLSTFLLSAQTKLCVFKIRQILQHEDFPVKAFEKRISVQRTCTLRSGSLDESDNGQNTDPLKPA